MGRRGGTSGRADDGRIDAPGLCVSTRVDEHAEATRRAWSICASAQGLEGIRAALPTLHSHTLTVMSTRLRTSLGLRPTLGGHLLARLLFARPRARRASFTRALFRSFGAALLLTLVALPAQAQRGRTTGSGQPTPTEERVTPTGETRRRDTTRAVQRRDETRPAPRERTEAQPPARREEARPQEPQGRRSTEARRPADLDATRRAALPSDRRPDDATQRTGGTSDVRERRDARGSTTGTGRVAQPDDRSAQPSRTARVVTVPGARDDRRWDPNLTVPGDRYGNGDRYRDERYRDNDRNRNDQRAGRPLGIDINWPWERRYSSGWSPRYRYRQVVYAESGRGRDRYETRYEVRTLYRQRVLSASGSRAQVELMLEELEVLQNGRYVGRITRLPSGFERIRATIYRNGRADFERELYVVGDAREGFELVATRGYDGYAFANWRRGDDLRAAYLDFRQQRAEPIQYSRLFDPYQHRGFTPISILPDDADWLGDFGPYSASAYPYYGGGYDRGYDGARYDGGGYGRDDRYYYGSGGVRVRPHDAPRGATSGSGEADDQRGYEGPRASTSGAAPAVPTLRRDSDRTYTTQGGASVRLRREAEIERVE